MRATVAGARTRAWPTRPLLISIRANRAMSCAVLKRPACPATPPIRRDVGSWTTPAQRHRIGPLARPRIERRAAFGRRDARQQRRRRQESRVDHPERLEDRPLRVDVQRLAAQPRHDVAEHEEVDVAVDEPFARRRGRHLVPRQLDGGVVSGPRLAQIDVRTQARHVRKEMADGDLAFAVALESRKDTRHRCRTGAGGPVRPAASPRSSSPRPW